MTGKDKRNTFSLGTLALVCAVVSGCAAPAYSAPDSKGTAPKAETTAKSPAAGGSSAKAGLPKVLDFGTSWCVPCKKFAPVFDKVALTYKDKVEFVHYDAEKGPGQPLADKYKVNTFPTVIFLNGAGKVDFKADKGLMTEADLIKHTDALLK